MTPAQLLVIDNHQAGCSLRDRQERITKVACVAERYAPSSRTIEVADNRDLRVELRLTANQAGR